jgi:hypothetical protein
MRPKPKDIIPHYFFFHLLILIYGLVKIHTLSGIQTHDPSVRESEGNSYVLDRAITVIGLARIRETRNKCIIFV